MDLRIVVITIFLVVIPPITAANPNAITQIINNLVQLTTGGIQFIKDSTDRAKHELPDTAPTNQEEYDYIVVGAGSAGATIASRLSEIPDAKVLLIEAGHAEHLLVDIPLIAPYLQFIPTLQWNYATEPSENYCLGMENNQCKVVIGKSMGGTTALNFMLATRGYKKDYDKWAEITNDDGWSYENILKYFKKLENFYVKRPEVDSELHNSDGPIHITNLTYQSKLVDAFIEAGKQMSFPSPIDYNGRGQIGFAYAQTTQVNGERLTTNRAYLHPAKNRKNLFVSMNSHVDRVLIDRNTKTAYGVEFTKLDEKIQVKARREVILSAGAMNSPKLLMLSGIGPEEHLKSFNIDVLENLPVGENLMDHVTYGGLTFLVNGTEGFVIPELLKPANPAFSDFLTKRKGPLTDSAGIEGLALFNVDDLEAVNDNPNIELLFESGHFGSDYFLHFAYGMREKHFQATFAKTLLRHGYSIWPVLLQPKSRGKVLLQSKNPKAKPKIIANYYSDPEDVRRMIKGIRLAIAVSKTEAFQRYDSRIPDHTIPGCDIHTPDSDDYWECALRTFTMSVWHYSGTCRMGRENDVSAVVNSKLQVRGIKNLRVADASVMPVIPSAHLNIPSIAIGEKLSDMLKSEW